MLYLPTEYDSAVAHMSLTARLLVAITMFAQMCGCQDISDKLYRIYDRSSLER